MAPRTAIAVITTVCILSTLGDVWVSNSPQTRSLDQQNNFANTSDWRNATSKSANTTLITVTRSTHEHLERTGGGTQHDNSPVTTTYLSAFSTPELSLTYSQAVNNDRRSIPGALLPPPLSQSLISRSLVPSRRKIPVSLTHFGPYTAIPSMTNGILVLESLTSQTSAIARRKIPEALTQKLSTRDSRTSVGTSPSPVKSKRNSPLKPAASNNSVANRPELKSRYTSTKLSPSQRSTTVGHATTTYITSSVPVNATTWSKESKTVVTIKSTTTNVVSTSVTWLRADNPKVIGKVDFSSHPEGALTAVNNQTFFYMNQWRIGFDAGDPVEQVNTTDQSPQGMEECLRACTKNKYCAYVHWAQKRHNNPRGKLRCIMWSNIEHDKLRHTYINGEQSVGQELFAAMEERVPVNQFAKLTDKAWVQHGNSREATLASSTWSEFMRYLKSRTKVS
jgi:hypothetical protein